MKKKLLALLTAVIVTACMVGCGSGGNEEPAAGETAEEPAAAELLPGRPGREQGPAVL